MARSFNGIDAQVLCGGRLPLDGIPTNPCTFTFWMRKQGYSPVPDTITHLHSRILSRETDLFEDGNNILRGWAIGLTNTGAITFTEHRRKDRKNADRTYHSPHNLIPDDKWVFVALTTLPTTLASDIHLYTSTLDDTTGVVEVQGGLRGDGDGTRVHAIDFGMIVGASHHNEGVRAWFKGEIADLRIYRLVLTRHEINHARCDDEDFSLPRICHYRFTHPGNFETDVSGRGNRADHRNTVLVAHPPPVPCIGITGEEPTPGPGDGKPPGQEEGGSLNGHPIPHPHTGSNTPAHNRINTSGTLGRVAFMNMSGNRFKTKYWVIRARKPGHHSRHGGRYH